MGVKKARPPADKPRAQRTFPRAAGDPVWHGSSAVEMQPGYPDIEHGDDGSVTTTLEYAGPYGAVAAVRPAVNAEVAGYSGRVVSTRLKGYNGGRGRLTVVIKVAPASVSEDPDPDTLTDRWEIDWVATEKPIVSNKKLVVTDSQQPIDEVAAWRDSPQQRKRNYQIPLATLAREPYPDNDDDWQDMDGVAKSVAQKIAAGIESWLEFTPVVTRVRIYTQPPNTGACGTIQTPATSIAGYMYLKNGDHLAQLADGTWQRTETWQGSQKWDTDLYEGGEA